MNWTIQFTKSEDRDIISTIGWRPVMANEFAQAMIEAILEFTALSFNG